MREETIKVYKFSELDPKVQEKVIEQFQNEDWLYSWQDENNETLKAFAKIFPVKVRDWEYGWGRERIDFELLIEDNHEELTGIRLMKHIINTYGRYLWKPKFLHKGAIGRGSVTGYSKIQKEASCVLTGYCMDESILEPIYNFLKKPEKGILFGRILKDCLRSWVHACKEDMEYAYTEEAIEEMLEANDYEFTAEGKVWR